MLISWKTKCEDESWTSSLINRTDRTRLRSWWVCPELIWIHQLCERAGMALVIMWFTECGLTNWRERERERSQQIAQNVILRLSIDGPHIQAHFHFAFRVQSRTSETCVHVDGIDSAEKSFVIFVAVRSFTCFVCGASNIRSVALAFVAARKWTVFKFRMIFFGGEVFCREVIEHNAWFDVTRRRWEN